jgi:hypothetical protein
MDSITETHHYCFPSQAAAEAMQLPQSYCAVDHVGAIEGAKGWHVNVRWLGVEPQPWTVYRIADPTNPVRVFA